MDRAWGLSSNEWSAVAALSAALTAAIALVASIIALRQLREMARDRKATSSLSFATATRESMTHLHSVLAHMVTTPGLRKCFYENAQADSDNEDAALAVAEMLADTIESSLEICEGMEAFKSHYDDLKNYGQILWDNSPSIRTVVVEAEGWYGDYLAASSSTRQPRPKLL